MKKAITYLFLCVYIFAQARPLSILVTDVVAHVFFERAHLATVHFENGHYHVHNEIQKAAVENKTDQAKPASSCDLKEDTQCCDEAFVFRINKNQSNLSIENPAGNLLAGFQIISSPPPESL